MKAHQGQTARETGDRAGGRLLLRVGLAGGPWIAVMAIATLGIAAAEIAFPAVLGRAFDAVISDGDAAKWLIWSGSLIAVLVICDTVDDLAGGAAIARSTAWLRHRLVAHVLALGTRAGERFSPGEATSRIVGSGAEAGRVAPDVIRAGANMIPAVGGAVALAVIDPWLCVTFVTGLPLLLLFVRSFARDSSELATRYFGAQGRITARLVDALSGARTIAAAGTVDREAERVLTPLPELHREGRGMWRAQRRISTQDAVLVGFLEIAVLAVAGAQLARGRISPGEMLAASQYVLLAATLTSAIPAVNRLTRSRAAAGRAAELLDQPAVAYGTAGLPDGDGRVELRGVTVRRDGKPLLEDVDLVMPAGALVAIAGQSGAGKTLLADLVARLRDPDDGEVLLDGVPLPELSAEELRREVVYGFERPALIGDTIADAIAFGGRTPTREEVEVAGLSAQADGFIRSMPNGYDTALRDAPMSGGEVQRVGLARAFAHAGRVMVLDDVAASLDTATEHQIGKVLTGALAGRTRLVIAHRASTAAQADTVIWLDGGRVRAMAPHAELCSDPDYRALFGPGLPVDTLPAGAENGAGP